MGNQTFDVIFRRTLTLGAFFVSFGVFATNYFVNEATTANDIYTTAIGNNANNGTSAATPKADLTSIWTTYGPSGSNVMAFGDTVFVDAGVYFQTERDLYLTVPFVVAGAGMDKTIFDNNDAGVTGFGCFRLGAGVHLQNFKIYRYGRQNTYAHAIHVEAGVTGVQIEAIHIDNCGRDSGLYPIEILSGAEVDIIGGGATCNTWLQSGGIRIQGATTDVDIIDYVLYENSRGFDNGAAIHIVSGTVRIRNSLFEGNQCNNGGESIIYMNTGNLTILDSEFKNNRYLYSFNEYGGTILVNGGTFTMKRSRVTGTSRIGGSFAYGGGACFDGTTGGITAQIDSCFFGTNTGSRGNDIHVKRAGTNVTVFQSTFASAADQVGFSTNGVMTLSNSGNPSVYNNFSGGSITKLNTTAPTYTASPSVPGYTGVCGSVVLLPVTLVAFDAFCENQMGQFVWTTMTESNNSHFELMHSIDGENWNSQAKIAGNGTTQSKQEYRYLMPNAETGYYLLKQTDYDGRSTTFEPLWLESCTAKNKDIRSHYNASSQTISFFGEFGHGSRFEVNIYNLMGQLVFSKSVSEQQDHITMTIDQPLTNGIYTFTIENESFESQGKLSIQY